MEEDKGKEDAFLCLQEAITNWGKLLLASGGALNPIKCFFHLISFQWDKNGNWTYKNNEEDEDYQAAVPLADGLVGEIQHLGINKPIETLGSMTSPSGCAKGSIKYADERDCLEGYDQGGQTEPLECMVEAILAKDLLRPLCSNSLLQRTVRMPHEDTLRDTPPRQDQTHS
jgi:hypothetical protein